MKTFHILIAEHVVRVRTASDMVRDWMLSNFYVKDETDIEGRLPDLTIRTDTGYGTPFESFDVSITEDEDMITFRRNDYVVKIDKWFHTAYVAVYDTFALKHAMMNLYSSFIVHHGWGLLIHSSCVVEGGKAYLFSGYSGAGKSTVAKLSMPRPLLSDEATIVKLNESGKALAYASPFRSELEMRADQKAYSLKGIYFLRQSQHVAAAPLSKGEGFLQLADKVFYWSYNPQETTKIFRLCRQLSERVPMFDLYFQKNDSFWEMIS